jgi:hypothetical protein
MKKKFRITAAVLAALALMHGSADLALGSPNRAKNRYYYEERGDMIWEVRTSQKVIALTFCDWQTDRRLSRGRQTRHS